MPVFLTLLFITGTAFTAAAADESTCCFSAVVADSHGNLYVNGRGSVLKVTPGGQVSALMKPRTRAESRATPFGATVMAIDDQDGIYTAAGTRVYKVLPDGTFTVLAAEFHNVRHMAVDAQHNVYVSDHHPTNGYRLCRITPEGAVTALTDSAGAPIGGKENVTGIGIDSAGNVVFSSMSQSCIRRLSPSGELTVVAGVLGKCGGPHDPKAFREGPVSQVRLWYPAAIAISKNDDIYFNDEYLRRVIKISNGRVTVVAGNSPIDQNGAFGNVQGGTAPGYRDGKAREALFTNNSALAFDHAGNLWIVDRIQVPGGVLRKLSPDGMVSTFLK